MPTQPRPRVRGNTRQRILEAAERVIREIGLARSTTKEIAEAVPCSEATLYRYFTTKEELFLAVLTEQLPGFVPALRTLARSTGAAHASVRTTLVRVAEDALAFYNESIPMFASIFAEPTLLASHQAWMRSTGTGPHRAIKVLADYLRAEADAGRVDPGVDAPTVAAMLLGACYQRSFFRDLTAQATPSDARFARLLVDTAWRMLRPTPA